MSLFQEIMHAQSQVADLGNLARVTLAKAEDAGLDDSVEALHLIVGQLINAEEALANAMSLLPDELRR